MTLYFPNLTSTHQHWCVDCEVLTKICLLYDDQECQHVSPLCPSCEIKPKGTP